jgi:hypothetical protein
MTREDAIKILNTVLFFGKCDCPKEEIEECLKMAIKALEQEPTTKIEESNFSQEQYMADLQSAYDCGYEQAKNDFAVDLISRADALDCVNWGYSFSDIYKKINELPSVTPQEPRWIPISERLPEPFEFVNCTCHSLIDDREDWVIETCYIPQLPNSPYSDWGNIPMLNSCECEVIAWVHRGIPKPYKAESEVDNENDN